ncbi:hypothetical protein [Anatilimnocola floriformis]|uniref:hypothetical protein n=1 Tax=Anatilimnocola floriformis TaxID=2948575 RepID=UPI0020C52214|nr:hypothetical protein [Anatilimnocola floriformis]
MLKRICSWVLLIGTLLPAAQADDRQIKIELPLKTPRSRVSVLGGPQDKAEFTVWVPAGVKTVRGAICNPFAKMEEVSPHWQAACRHWGFAYVQADFDAVKKDEYLLLEKGLKHAATETGHSELASMPLCFLGMSRGGGMSMQLAELMPARTIASSPVCLEVGPTSPATRQIPVLTVFGDKDGTQLEKLLQKLPGERSEEARWAIAVQWGRGHEFGQANNLSFVFFDDVIRTRLPVDAHPGEGAVLKPFPLVSGWLSGPIEWVKNKPVSTAPAAAPYDRFTGDRSSAVWLPSGRAAAVWQAFVSASREVQITEPAGLGDGQKFAIQPADRRLKFVGKIAGDKPTKIEVWNGDVHLATITEEPWEVEVGPLTPGIHSIIFKAIGTDATRSSRPHTIVVSTAAEIK